MEYQDDANDVDFTLLTVIVTVTYHFWYIIL